MSSAPHRGTSPGHDAWRRFKKNRLATAGAVIVLLMAFFGFSAPLLSAHLTHFSLDEQHHEFKAQPPGTADLSKDHPTFDGDPAGFDTLDLNHDGRLDPTEQRQLHQAARFLLFLFDDYDRVRGDATPTGTHRLQKQPDGFLNPAELPATFSDLEATFQDEVVDAVAATLPPGQRQDFASAQAIAANTWDQLGLLRGPLFQRTDTDHNGYITTQEWNALRLVYRPFESLRWARTYYDGNGDGVMQASEYPGRPRLYRFWLGTDHLGRDVLTRLFYGARISITIALMATLVSFLIGVSWGAIAGYYGGRIDSVMMRTVDVLYGLPFMFIVILLIVVFGRSTFNLFIALGAVQWLTMSRVVRGQIISLKTREFVEAAVAMGVPKRRIIVRHLLPNTVGPVIVYATLMVPAIILEEAFLSFLGLGVQPPNPSWGNMITDGAKVMDSFPWLIIYPGIALSLTLFAMNFVGDGLRDALDPHMQKD